MFNLDPGKLIIIAVVAIILLGPDKLPQVARQVGGAWRSFGEFRRRMESEVRSTMPDLPPSSEIARLARSPAALLHHLSTMSDEDEDKVAPTAGAEDAGGASADAAEEPVKVDEVVDEAVAATADGLHGAPTGTLPTTDGAHDAGSAYDAGTNGSGPSGPGSGSGSGPGAEPGAESQALRPPSEPAVQADPNLN
jgi:sec-independent protein translocase protein TatB